MHRACDKKEFDFFENEFKTFVCAVYSCKQVCLIRFTLVQFGDAYSLVLLEKRNEIKFGEKI